MPTDKTSSSVTASRNDERPLPPIPSSSRQLSKSATIRGRDSKPMPSLPSTPVRERVGDGRRKISSSNPSNSTISSKAGADAVTYIYLSVINYGID